MINVDDILDQFPEQNLQTDVSDVSDILNQFSPTVTGISTDLITSESSSDVSDILDQFPEQETVGAAQAPQNDVSDILSQFPEQPSAQRPLPPSVLPPRPVKDVKGALGTISQPEQEQPDMPRDSMADKWDHVQRKKEIEAGQSGALAEPGGMALAGAHQGLDDQTQPEPEGHWTGRALRRGFWKYTVGTPTGLLGWTGSVAAGGAEEGTAAELREWGFEKQQAAMRKVDENRADVDKDFFSVAKDLIQQGSVGQFGKWVAEGMLEFVPQTIGVLLASMAISKTAALALPAAVAAKVAMGLKGADATGRGAQRIGALVVKKSVEKEAAKLLTAKGLSLATADAAAKEAAFQAAASKVTGSVVNKATSALIAGGMYTGSNWAEVYERYGEDNPASALASGLWAGAVSSLIPHGSGKYALVQKHLGKNKAAEYAAALDNGAAGVLGAIVSDVFRIAPRAALEEFGQESGALFNALANDPDLEGFAEKAMGYAANIRRPAASAMSVAFASGLPGGVRQATGGLINAASDPNYRAASIQTQYDSLVSDFGQDRVQMDGEDAITVALPNDKGLRIQFESDISETVLKEPTAFLDSVRQEGGARGVKAVTDAMASHQGNAVEAAKTLVDQGWMPAGFSIADRKISDENGNTTTLGALVLLERGMATKENARHEIWHALKELGGTTAEEQAELDAVYQGNEEAEAIAFSKKAHSTDAFKRLHKFIGFLTAGKVDIDGKEKALLKKIKKNMVERLKAERVAVEEPVTAQAADATVPADASKVDPATKSRAERLRRRRELDDMQRSELFEIADNYGMTLKKGAEKSKVITAIIEAETTQEDLRPASRPDEITPEIITTEIDQMAGGRVSPAIPEGITILDRPQESTEPMAQPQGETVYVTPQGDKRIITNHPIYGQQNIEYIEEYKGEYIGRTDNGHIVTVSKDGSTVFFPAMNEEVKPRQFVESEDNVAGAKKYLDWLAKQRSQESTEPIAAQPQGVAGRTVEPASLDGVQAKLADLERQWQRLSLEESRLREKGMGELADSFSKEMSTILLEYQNLKNLIPAPAQQVATPAISDDALTTEAKKYKSAEEFVANVDREKLEVFKQQKRDAGEKFSFSDFTPQEFKSKQEWAEKVFKPTLTDIWNKANQPAPAEGKAATKADVHPEIPAQVAGIATESAEAIEAQTVVQDDGSTVPANLIDAGQEVRVRSGYGQQAWEVVEAYTPNEAESADGEQFYKLKNKLTGEVADFEQSDIQTKQRTMRQMSKPELRTLAKRNGVSFNKGDGKSFLIKAIKDHMNRQLDGKEEDGKFSVRNIEQERSSLIDYMANFQKDEIGIKELTGTWGATMRFFSKWFLFGEARLRAGSEFYNEAIERFFNIQTSTDRAMAKMNNALTKYAKQAGLKDTVGLNVLQKGDEAIAFALEEKGGREKLDTRQQAIYDILKTMIDQNLDTLIRNEILEKGWLDSAIARKQQELDNKLLSAEKKESIRQEIKEISELQGHLDSMMEGTTKANRAAIDKVIKEKTARLTDELAKDSKNEKEIERLQNEINKLQTRFEGYMSHVLVYRAVIDKINSQPDTIKRRKAITGLTAFFTAREGVNTLREYTEKWTDSKGVGHEPLLDATDINAVKMTIEMTADTMNRVQMKMLYGVLQSNNLMIPAMQKTVTMPDGRAINIEESGIKWVDASQMSGIDKRGIKDMKFHPIAAMVLQELGQTDRKQRNPFDRMLGLVKIGQFFAPGIIWTYNPLQAVIGGVPMIRWTGNLVRAGRAVLSQNEEWEAAKQGGAFQNPGLPTEATKDQQIDAYIQKITKDVSTGAKLVNAATQTKAVGVKEWLNGLREQETSSKKAGYAVQTIGQMIESPYRAIGQLTWLGDNIQRMATYYTLQDLHGETKTSAEIARHVGDIHGAYGKTSEAYRRIGGRIFFVHTFRLLMPHRIFKGMTGLPQMLAETAIGKRKWDSYTGAEKYQATLAFAGTVGLPIATFMMMTANGWEPDEEGLPDWWLAMKAKIPIGMPFPTLMNHWKFKKTVTMPDGRQKEMITGINNIVNMPTKWIERASKDRPERLDDMWYHVANLMKWELSPLYRIALDIVTNESSMGGDAPVDRTDNMYKQIFDATKYAFGNSFRIYNTLIDNDSTTAQKREVKANLDAGLNAVEKVLLGYYTGYTKAGPVVPVSFGYTYTRNERRKRLGSALRSLEYSIAEEKRKAKQIHRDRPDKYREKIIALKTLERTRKARLKKIFLGMGTEE